MSVPAAVPAISRPRRPDIDRFLLLLQKEKNETRRTVSSCQRLRLGRGGRGLRRRCGLYRRRAVRRAAGRGELRGGDRPGRGVCPPLRSAGPRHAQHARVGRRTGGRRTAGPGADRRGRRRADRAGHGSAADGPSGGAARLDAGFEPHARGGAVLGRGGVCAGDSRTQPHAGGDPGHLRRHRGRGRMLRPRGGLRGVQRPLFPLAVDVRAQRQSRGVQPALPPDVGPQSPGSTCCRYAT